jgi:UDP-2-acetamido-2-deoxy-ribo-hexuluronate aminotransferase
MSVPFIDLKRFEDDFLNRWNKKVAKLSENASFIGGDEVERLEETLTRWTENKFAVTCGNGTDAIQLALRALDVGKNDLVLVPNMTFWATFEAIVNVGATPVTVDSDLNDGGIDLDAFVKAVEKLQPKAAVIAHLYGWGTVNLKKIRDFCKLKNVLLVEDGAQCFGTQYQGDSIYKGALISTTSFYPAKVLGGAGDGGAVFSNDPMLAKRARQLSNHGRTSHYGYGLVGWNSRLDALQAAYLNIAIGYLPARIESRRAAVKFYQKKLSDTSVYQMFAPVDYLENGYCNVGLIENADLKSSVEAALRSNDIGFGNIYPGAMSDQECSSQFMHSHVGGVEAQKICKSVINLPVFPYITHGELDTVVNVIKSVCEDRQR